MRITEYGLELNDDMHPILIKEQSTNYPSEDRDLSSPQKIVQMCNDIFRMNRLAEEKVLLIAMNSKCFPVGIFEVSRGTVNYSVANPREIFIRLLLSGASCFSLVHNHPSQNVEPSASDICSARQIKSAGELMGIQLLDCIIIGNGFYSFHEHAMLR